MADSEMDIRTMTREDMAIAIEYARREGWNPGLSDAASFFAADPQGFLIGELYGEFAGCLSAVRYGEDFGFLGFYIVRPDLRGHGYGLQLWAEGIRRLRGRRMGLDGVLEQQDNYRKSGFELAYRNIRFEGSGQGDPGAARGFQALSDVPFNTLSQYDQGMFSESREPFLRAWIAQPGAIGLASVENEKMEAYGLIRPCYTGWKIGPLFADTEDLAEKLLEALLGQARAGDPVYYDAPEINPIAVQLAETRGMTRVFETARMYKGQAPSIPIDRLYGVTSFELG